VPLHAPPRPRPPRSHPFPYTTLFRSDRPLCVSLRPNLVTKRQHAANAAASESLYGALARLERALLGDEELRRELDLSPTEDRLRSEEHTSELQSPDQLVCRLLLEKKK